MDNIPSVLRVDLLVNLARYSSPQRRIQKVLLTKRKLLEVLLATTKNTGGQQFLTQCLHLGPWLIFDTMIVAGYQNSCNSGQNLFLQSTSTSTPLDIDTMMLRLLELTQMQKLSQDDPRLNIFWSIDFFSKQGNYSLRRPPKLIINKNIHWPKMGYLQSTHIHVSSNNCQKRHQFAPRFGTCMYDPYTSIYTIIQ